MVEDSHSIPEALTPESIVTEITDSIAVVRFNRPAQRNSLSLDTLQELKRILSAVIGDEVIEAIVITGTDDVFASGADIRELAELDPPAALKFSKLGQDLFQTIADAKQITIAAINGYCMGGGLDLALACDIRVASKDAVFAHPGARLGILTGWGGTQRLPRIIGSAHALEFFLTARRYTSIEAFRIGLITEIADPVLDHAIELAADKKKGGGRSATFNPA
jgi:enoyl-CoA hydratase/carnithine racemase